MADGDGLKHVKLPMELGQGECDASVGRYSGNITNFGDTLSFGRISGMRIIGTETWERVLKNEDLISRERESAKEIDLIFDFARWRPLNLK